MLEEVEPPSHETSPSQETNKPNLVTLDLSFELSFLPEWSMARNSFKAKKREPDEKIVKKVP